MGNRTRAPRTASTGEVERLARLEHEVRELRKAMKAFRSMAAVYAAPTFNESHADAARQLQDLADSIPSDQVAYLVEIGTAIADHTDGVDRDALSDVPDDLVDRTAVHVGRALGLVSALSALADDEPRLFDEITDAVRDRHPELDERQVEERAQEARDAFGFTRGGRAMSGFAAKMCRLGGGSPNPECEIELLGLVTRLR